MILKRKKFSKLHSHLTKSALKNLNDIQGTNDNETFKNLLDIAKSNGTSVAVDNNTVGGGYGGSAVNKRALNKIISAGRKSGMSDEEILKNIVKTAPDYLPNPGKLSMDGVVLGQGGQNSAILAHELGHSHYGGYSKDRSKNFIVKGAARARNLADSLSGNNEPNKKKAMIGKVGSNIGSFGAGFASGFKSAKDKDETGKSSVLTNLAGYAAPTLLAAPRLIDEGAASIKGMKLLKKAGANDKLIKNARKGLGFAFGSYVVDSATPFLSAAGGRVAGKIAYKLKKKKSKKKESNIQ